MVVDLGLRRQPRRASCRCSRTSTRRGRRSPARIANATLAARRPIQGFGTISAVLPEAFSNYHALQARVEYRTSASLNLLNSFTWSQGDRQRQPGARGAERQHRHAAERLRHRRRSRAVRLRRAAPERHELRLEPAVRAAARGSATTCRHRAERHPRRLAGERHPHDAQRPHRQPALQHVGPDAGDVGSAVVPRRRATCGRTSIGDPLAPEIERSIDNYFNRDNVTLPPATAPFGNAGAQQRPRLRLLPARPRACRSGSRCRSATAPRSRFAPKAFNVLNKTNFGAAQRRPHRAARSARSARRSPPARCSSRPR